MFLGLGRTRGWKGIWSRFVRCVPHCHSQCHCYDGHKDDDHDDSSTASAAKPLLRSGRLQRTIVAHFFVALKLQLHRTDRILTIAKAFHSRISRRASPFFL